VGLEDVDGSSVTRGMKLISHRRSKLRRRWRRSTVFRQRFLTAKVMQSFSPAMYTREHYAHQPVRHYSSVNNLLLLSNSSTVNQTSSTDEELYIINAEPERCLCTESKGQNQNFGRSSCTPLARLLSDGCRRLSNTPPGLSMDRRQASCKSYVGLLVHSILTLSQFSCIFARSYKFVVKVKWCCKKRANNLCIWWNSAKHEA